LYNSNNNIIENQNRVAFIVKSMFYVLLFIYLLYFSDIGTLSSVVDVLWCRHNVHGCTDSNWRSQHSI